MRSRAEAGCTNQPKSEIQPLSRPVHAPVVLVSATRSDQAEFVRSAFLARSLRRAGTHWPLRLRLFPENVRPLPECYNQAIDECGAEDVLVFVHDDVYIDDWAIGQHIQDALRHFDVVGVAGNVARQPMQLAWHCKPARALNHETLQLSDWDTANLSGSVAHGDPGRSIVQFYGPTPKSVAMLDGVLIAARAAVLRKSAVRFDPQFAFHFYDLDFCRTAIAAGLRLGTWPLAITHASQGQSIHSEAWQQSAGRYLTKWGD